MQILLQLLQSRLVFRQLQVALSLQPLQQQPIQQLIVRLHQLQTKIIQQSKVMVHLQLQILLMPLILMIVFKIIAIKRLEQAQLRTQLHRCRTVKIIPTLLVMDLLPLHLPQIIVIHKIVRQIQTVIKRIAKHKQI